MFTADINTGLIEFKETERAVLLDVRTPMEYAQG
ncbi:MAG: rhodanese-like domain-containing protein, partial [Clostridiales bacterium]|nr:rhodanese-like domain-containing protein [Clostridiales bacterium]